MKKINIKQRFYQNNPDNHILEVCLILFKKCNLKCAFCFQDHNESIDVEYIKSIPLHLENNLRQILSTKRYTQVTYRIWGGELFSDDIDDDMFELYGWLEDQLYDIGTHLGVTTQICYSSNLVFSNINRVIDIINRHPTNILATSYDPVYRFKNINQIHQWCDNASKLQPKVVSITLTKQNINKFINEHEHLDRLIAYPINIEYYIYNKLYDFFKPSETDLFNFFKYCIEQGYTNICEINELVRSSSGVNTGRYCNCNNSCLYIDESLTFNCLKRSSNLPLNQFFDVVPREQEYTEAQLMHGLTQKNCVTCENYSFCRMPCMASVAHKTYDGSQCCFKMLYQYLKNHGQ